MSVPAPQDPRAQPIRDLRWVMPVPEDSPQEALLDEINRKDRDGQVN